MGARLIRIGRMRPDDRFNAVASFIEGAAILGDLSPVMDVTYRRSRSGESKTERLEVVGVAWNDNGTSSGELIVRPGSTHRLYGIALPHVDALELPGPAGGSR